MTNKFFPTDKYSNADGDSHETPLYVTALPIAGLAVGCVAAYYFNKKKHWGWKSYVLCLCEYHDKLPATTTIHPS